MKHSILQDLKHDDERNYQLCCSVRSRNGIVFGASLGHICSLLLSTIYQHFWHFKNSAFRTQTIWLDDYFQKKKIGYTLTYSYEHKNAKRSNCYTNLTGYKRQYCILQKLQIKFSTNNSFKSIVLTRLKIVWLILTL